MTARHGGRRKGAGRKPGSKTAKTMGIARLAVEAGISPLEVMLVVMRQHFEAGDGDKAASIARDCAPYVHPRLSAVQVSGDEPGVNVNVTVVGGIDVAAVVGQRPGLHLHDRAGETG